MNFGGHFIVGLFALSTFLEAQPSPVLSREQIYKLALSSTVAIFNNSDSTHYWTATGVVLNCNQGLVVTNYHAISDDKGPKKTVKVSFPLVGKNGLISTFSEYYDKNRWMWADVRRFDASKDLAFIILQGKAPKYCTNSVMADSRKVRAGDVVHTMGNPNGEMWAFLSGKVISREKMTIDMKDMPVPVKGMMIDSNFPSTKYKGFSGGALRNSWGELLGLLFGGDQKNKHSWVSIDVSEILAFHKRAK